MKPFKQHSATKCVAIINRNAYVFEQYRVLLVTKSLFSVQFDARHCGEYPLVVRLISAETPALYNLISQSLWSFVYK